MIRLVSACKKRSQASPAVLNRPLASKERHWSRMAISSPLSATGAAATHTSVNRAKEHNRLLLAFGLAAMLSGSMVFQNCLAVDDEMRLPATTKTFGVFASAGGGRAQQYTLPIWYTSGTQICGTRRGRVCTTTHTPHNGAYYENPICTPRCTTTVGNLGSTDMHSRVRS